MGVHELTEAEQTGGPLYGLQMNDEGRLVVFGGGFPLKAGGEVVGAVGSSGGMPDEDVEIARVAVENLRN